MSVSMSRVCPQCGETLPAEALFCPRDGSRVANTGPFGGLEATAVRPASSPGATAKPPAAFSSQASAPASADPRSQETNGLWEATVARDVMVGKQLGDFVVKRRIGDGGMGIVYEGEHPIIGRKVAIKILRPELTSGAMARDLAAEARAASAIRHRGIIDVFGFGTIPGIGQYLVMEYLEGTPLNEIIAKRAPMPEAEVIPLLDELLAALGAAHAVGVIHRDLKPGNVFVERDSSGAESVKVLDFGLAKRSESPHGSTPQTRASLIVGTPEYIAPEQAHGQSVSPRTDLYAAGLIAFEMLTRRLPFEGPSPMSIIVQHMQTEPPAPSSFVELHPRLDALVLKMLAKEPSQRPASAEEIRRELKLILREVPGGGTAVALRPPSASLPKQESADSEEIAPTVVRATPQAPLASPKPRSLPVSGARAREDVPAARAKEAATTLIVAKSTRPPDRRPLMGAIAVVAVALAAVGGWALRGRSSAGDAPPAVAQAPAVSPSATPAPAPPAPSTPPVSPTPTPEPVAPAIAQSPPARAEGSSEADPDEDDDSASTSPDKSRVRKGILKLVVRGSGTIRVDGKVIGEVPPINRLSLPEGEHKLEILNSRAYPYKAMITITHGQPLTQRVTLRPISSGGGAP